MLAKLGVNVDFANPGGRPEPERLALFGWARLVARGTPGFEAYVGRLTAAGIRVILVLAGESFAPGDRGAQAQNYARLLSPACWQIGNEPDLRSPASWSMAPAAYAALAGECTAAIRRERPAATIISAGLAGREAGWLGRCGALPLDGVAVHLYGLRPSRESWPPPWNLATVDGRLRRYRRYGRPLWVTEFGANNGRPGYVARVYRALAAQPSVVAACVFCYSDAMVPGFGLTDRRGASKPAYERLAALAGREAR